MQLTVAMGSSASHIHWGDGQYRNPVLKSRLIKADVSYAKLQGESGAANPSEKPAAFFEALLVGHTNCGEVVLDVFGGVGGMMSAAVKHLRDVVIIERDPTQFDLYDGVLSNAFDAMKVQLKTCWKLPKASVIPALPFEASLRGPKPPYNSTDLILYKHDAVKGTYEALTVGLFLVVYPI